MLSDKQIIEFQRIYKEKFGKEISRKSSYKEGVSLINLYISAIDFLIKDDKEKNEN